LEPDPALLRVVVELGRHERHLVPAVVVDDAGLRDAEQELIQRVRRIEGRDAPDGAKEHPLREVPRRPVGLPAGVHEEVHAAEVVVLQRGPGSLVHGLQSAYVVRAGGHLVRTYILATTDRTPTTINTRTAATTR